MHQRWWFFFFSQEISHAFQNNSFDKSEERRLASPRVGFGGGCYSRSCAFIGGRSYQGFITFGETIDVNLNRDDFPADSVVGVACASTQEGGAIVCAGGNTDLTYEYLI